MANDFVEMKDPDAVRAGAVRLTADGEAEDASAQARVSAIEGIEAEAPWGGDKYGTAFLHSYNAADGGGPGASSSAKSELSEIGQDAVKIGDATTRAVLDYTTTDETNATDINSVR